MKVWSWGVNFENYEDQRAVSKEKLQWFWDGLDAYLSKTQLKQTKQRKLIVSHFLSMKAHIDAEELYEKVRSEGQNIGLATIYRTLNLLRDAGLVEQNSFADGRAVFEIIEPGNHHDHIICTECGKVVEFENSKIEELQRQVALENGFLLTSHRLDLYGCCEACRT